MNTKKCNLISNLVVHSFFYAFVNERLWNEKVASNFSFENLGYFTRTPLVFRNLSIKQMRQFKTIINQFKKDGEIISLQISLIDRAVDTYSNLQKKNETEFST